MTENRRIFFNIVATYGRSLFALACGLFTSRWVLMALGKIDLGLFATIGGVMAFIAFFNSILAGAIGRYYAISIGEVKTAEDRQGAVENCQRWFNTALSIHTFVPIVLILIGYPIGAYAIQNGWLTIPPDRIEACLWVFRFTCISCFVGMVNVPFQAMYTAKQYIAELTVYSFVTTTLNVCFLYYMVSHPGDWLARYALWMCLMSIVPQMIITLRALKIFPECKINFAFWYDKTQIKNVLAFAGWTMLGTFCGLLRNQGMTIVVNKAFGPQVNAAQGIANTINGHTSTLSGALTGAFMPAITTACGAKEYEKMRKMVLRASKFAILLSLLFTLPLSLELPKILELWLVNPPEYTLGLTWCALVLYLIDVSTQGHMIAINANGKVKIYNFVMSAVNIFTVPVAVLFAWLGFGVYVSIGYVMVGGIVLNTIGRVFFARHFVGVSIRHWVFKIILPTGLVMGIVGGIGILPHFFMPASFLRICVTTILCEMLFIPLSWTLLLDKEEKVFVLDKVRVLLAKVTK